MPSADFYESGRWRSKPCATPNNRQKRCKSGSNCCKGICERQSLPSLSKPIFRDAKARIREALEAAAEGRTELAKAIFSEVEARKIKGGRAAHQEAAEAARHRGVLVFLHDTDKALAAYRRAIELDPENAEAWNGFGLLWARTGALDEAEAAYRELESLGEFSIKPAATWIGPRPCTRRA